MPLTAAHVVNPIIINLANQKMCSRAHFETSRKIGYWRVDIKVTLVHQLKGNQRMLNHVRPGQLIIM